jgi:hypothetical protein
MKITLSSHSLFDCRIKLQQAFTARAATEFFVSENDCVDRETYVHISGDDTCIQIFISGMAHPRYVAKTPSLSRIGAIVCRRSSGN